MLKRFTIFVLLLMFSATVLAQYDHPRKAKRHANTDSRDGRFEAGLVIPYQNSASIKGESGSGIEIDSSVGWGFFLGWNWTESVNFSYTFMMNKPKYVATIIPDDLLNQPIEIGYKMSKMDHRFNATYNILKRSFTPFVTAGIGYTKLDSNIPRGINEAACWWDPWYGYICATNWKTFEQSEFTYNVGVGVRWDFSDYIFSKAAYSKEFLSLDNGSLNFDYLSVEMGLLF